MKKFTYMITDMQGIHARPAGLLVKQAGEFKSDIKIGKGDKIADAKRIFGVMGLGAKQGEEVFIIAEGEDEDKAAESLEMFFKENL